MNRDLAGLGEAWRMRVRDGGVETGGGDGSETGSKTKGKQIEERHRCQPHPRLQGQRGDQQHYHRGVTIHRTIDASQWSMYCNSQCDDAIPSIAN